METETKVETKIEIVSANYLDEAHARDLCYLLDRYAKDEMGGAVGLTEEVKSNLAAELSKRPHAFSLLCYVNNRAAGLINCFEAFSTFKCKPLINIHDVIVVDEFRGHGLSQRMLAAVEEIARERGCCKLTLEVLEGNVPAKNSYLKYGFTGYELDPVFGRALFWEKSL